MRLRRMVFVSLCIAVASAGLISVSPRRAVSQAPDSRIAAMRDADRNYTPRMEDVDTLDRWNTRRRIVRETLLLRSGLWPEPEKCPLNVKVFDERAGDGFTVSKVYFESLPGYFATGNLYRPSKGTPPYPAVITPHGHWGYGRLQNSEQGSIPGRCIDFARMGFVVFSIDMVGYNDSFQLPHDPFKSRAQLKADVPQPYEPRTMRADFDFPDAELYGFNLGGVQAWNAIRGVDFLESLPYVDKNRIGATGASGGASQTIFLMIADDRIKVAAPVNIIGVEKHPGCKCENMPGLWIDTSTIELAAAFAPRPLLLMSATEDPWTHSTPTREYPMLRKYYDLFGAGDMIKNVHITAGHNYNADTRAAVYEWFCTHLDAPFPPIRKPVPVSPELQALGDLRVFPDGVLPENAVTGFKVMTDWKQASERRFAEDLPSSPCDVERFASLYKPMLARALTLNTPFDGWSMETLERRTAGTVEIRRERIGKEGDDVSAFTVESIHPRGKVTGTALVVYPDEDGGFFIPGTETLAPWASDLTVRGYRVCRMLGYASGEHFIPRKTWDSFSWPSTYNRGNELWGVHDVAVATAVLKSLYPGDKLVVAGLKRCGLVTAFACAVTEAADKVIVDLDRSDPGYDGELVSLLPVGGVRRVGDLRTAALLLMRKPLTLANAGPTFDAAWYTGLAKRCGLSGNLTIRHTGDAFRFTDAF